MSPLAPAAVITAAAELIRHHGYAPHDAGEDTAHRCHTITSALVEAAAGPRASLVTGPALDSLLAAIGDLQAAWGCRLDAFERIRAGDDAWTVAWHLDMAARHATARAQLAAA